MSRSARQDGLQLIASENFTSPAVLEAHGHGAHQQVRRRATPAGATTAAARSSTRSRTSPSTGAKELFGAEHANVQPHSGAQANMAGLHGAAASRATRCWGMHLDHGGHLTHGSPLNFSGKFYNFVPYGVAPRRDERIDLRRRSRRWPRNEKPKMIVGGRDGLPAHHRLPTASREIADAVRRAAHGRHGPHRRAGGGGLHPSPVPARRLRHHHHAQDAARPARRADPLPTRSSRRRSTRPSSPASRAGR